MIYIGIELLEYVRKWNVVLMQRTQYKLLRSIVSALWYVTNVIILSDLSRLIIVTVDKNSSGWHHQRIESHLNTIVSALLETCARRLLKKKWPINLLLEWRNSQWSFSYRVIFSDNKRYRYGIEYVENFMIVVICKINNN